MLKHISILLLLFCAVTLSAQPDCVIDACCCGDPVEVGIPNGNFEDPPMAPPDGRITFYAGEMYSTWSVLGGSIDLLGPNYSNFTAGNPNGPSQFIDLNGFAPGTIATQLTGLMPGATYTIVLWYAINPGATVATCNIQVAGGAWLNATWSATNAGGDIWLEKCFSFTAQGPSAELRFIGSSNFTTAGMLLDDMTMWKCPLDNEAPVAANLPPSPLLLACSDPLPPNDLSGTDNCSAEVTIDFTEQTIPQACYYNLLRTWTLSDECANTSTVTQLIQVRDTEAPQFLTLPEDYILPCGGNYTSAFLVWVAGHGGGDATDNCDPDLTWTALYQQGPNGQCGATPVQFTVRDDCGNAGTATAYFVIEDFDPPQLLQEAQNDTVWCATSPAALLAWLNTHGGALATDPCGPVVWTNNYSGNPTQEVIEVTFTATDKCQNSVSTTASFVQPVVSDTIVQLTVTCDPMQAGSDTLVVTQGNCETITITTVNLLASDTTLLYDASCDVGQTGIFTQNLTNQNGCDSVVITTVSLLASDTTLLFDANCDVGQTGIFAQNLTNQNGCDSVVITTVSLLASDTTLLFGTNCDTAQTGVFTQNLTNQNGCDSIVITTVSPLASDTTLLFDASCDVGQTGVFTQSLTNQNGCDSLVITTVNLLASDTTLLFDASCDVGQTGIFTQNLTNQNGCDSLVITTVSLLASDTTLLFDASCDAGQTGVFTQNLTNQNGCDSVVITTVSLLPADSTFLSATTCDPAAAGVFVQQLSNRFGCDSTVFETVVLVQKDTTWLFDRSCNPASVGVFTQNYLNQGGCDSLVITTVDFAQSDTTLLAGTTCDPGAAGVFTQNFITPEGCDSVVITSVSVLPSDTVSVSSTTCDPVAAGVFIQHLINRFGCDSTVTETVTLLPRDTTLLLSSTCNAANAGVFTQQLTNQYGCDSLVLRSVAFIPLDTTLLMSTTCDPAAAGVFTQQLITGDGCDSVVVRQVALLPSDQVSVASTTCDPAAAGVFVQHLINRFGCDSTVTETVVLLASDTTLLSGTTCNPANAGVFIQQLNNQNGCDSVVVTSVSLLPLPQLSVLLSDFNGFAVSCAGETDGMARSQASGAAPPFDFQWSTGSLQAEINDLAAGIYTVTTTDANGCSTVSSVTLGEPPLFQAAFGATDPDCAGNTTGSVSVAASGGVAPYQYSLDGAGFQSSGVFKGLSAGTYQTTVRDANGCEYSETLTIEAPMPVSVALGDDLTIHLGDSLILQALVNVPPDSLASVSWSLSDTLICPMCLTQVVKPLRTGVYSVRVVAKNGCSGEDQLTVFVDRRKDIYIPDIFSPNGDGINDVFLIFARPGLVRSIRSFRVFDRWGEAVCEYRGVQPNDPDFGWDGFFRGRPLNPGVFAWYAEIEFSDGETEVFSGDVTLVR